MLAVLTRLWAFPVMGHLLTKLVKLKALDAVVGAGLKSGESLNNNPGSNNQVRHEGGRHGAKGAARSRGCGAGPGRSGGAGAGLSCRLLPGHWDVPEVNSHAALELLGTTRAGSRSPRAWSTAVRRARWARAA